MKKIVTLLVFCTSVFCFSQQKETSYVVEGDLVKATYYHENGAIKTVGYFKNKKLTGKWVRYDNKGNKTQMAFYNNGKKVGKWFVWSKDNLKEITYKENAIVAVNLWKHEAKLALNK